MSLWFPLRLTEQLSTIWHNINITIREQVLSEKFLEDFQQVMSGDI